MADTTNVNRGFRVLQILFPRQREESHFPTPPIRNRSSLYWEKLNQFFFFYSFPFLQGKCVAPNNETVDVESSCRTNAPFQVGLQVEWAEAYPGSKNLVPSGSSYITREDEHTRYGSDFCLAQPDNQSWGWLGFIWVALNHLVVPLREHETGLAWQIKFGSIVLNSILDPVPISLCSETFQSFQRSASTVSFQKTWN